MTPPDSLSPSAEKPLRSDGQDARLRLLDVALQLFADQGFAKTSIRDIAQAAHANVASISYYFGDKEGLYRAAFNDPRVSLVIAPTDINHPDVSLVDALRVIVSSMTEQIKQGERAQSCMKLHFREMLEPTGLWQADIENNIQPAHDALVQVLCRHLGLAEADDEVHRLSFSIAGLGIILHIGNDVIQAVRPGLMTAPDAIDAYTDHMLRAALSMVEGEARRRQAQRTQV